MCCHITQEAQDSLEWVRVFRLFTLFACELCALSHCHLLSYIIYSFEQKVVDAMFNQTSLWLRYNTGGIEGGRVREVIPDCWIQTGNSFFAHCVSSGKRKQYYLDRIRQASTVPMHD